MSTLLHNGKDKHYFFKTQIICDKKGSRACESLYGLFNKSNSYLITLLAALVPSV